MGELGGDQSSGMISRRAQKPGELRRFKPGELRRFTERPAASSTQMEQTSDLGLGDSSLFRYLDGELWSLKNELRRALESSPLFQPRYLVELRLLFEPRLADWPQVGLDGVWTAPYGQLTLSLPLIKKGSPSRRSVVIACCRLPDPLKVSLPPQLSPKIPG